MRVPFHVRLQMYPRMEMWLIFLIIPLIGLPISLSDNNIGGAALLAVFFGIAMYVAVPEASRYRALGIPMSYWILDTAIAVHVLALACLGLWAFTGFYLWPFIGIIAADIGVLAWSFYTNRHLTRGDRRAVPFDKQSGSWTSPTLFTGFGPVAWRVLYAPLLVTAAYFGAIFVGFVFLLSSGSGGLRSSALMAMIPPLTFGLAHVLSVSRCNWQAMGLPVKSWLAHAYSATSCALVILATATLLLIWGGTSDGLFGGEVRAGQVMLVIALLLLLISGLVFIVTTEQMILGAILILMICFPLFLAVEIGDRWPLGSALLFAGAALAAAVALTVVTYRRVTAGDRLRPLGLVQGPDRNYYELEGAAS